MSWQVSSTQPLPPVAPPGAGGSARATGDFAGALRAEQADRADVLGTEPPPEARAMLEAAQRAIQHLHEQGRELHFEVQRGQVTIEVRDLDGNVLDRIPPGRALDLLTQTPPTEHTPWTSD
jgi:hypothetical protein